MYCSTSVLGTMVKLFLNPTVSARVNISVKAMKKYIYVIEKCAATNLYVGYIPGFPGAQSQAETLDELSDNMREVVEMLLEDGEPQMETDFVGTQTVLVA